MIQGWKSVYDYTVFVENKWEPEPLPNPKKTKHFTRQFCQGSVVNMPLISKNLIYKKFFEICFFFFKFSVHRNKLINFLAESDFIRYDHNLCKYFFHCIKNIINFNINLYLSLRPCLEVDFTRKNYQNFVLLETLCEYNYLGRFSSYNFDLMDEEAYNIISYDRFILRTHLYLLVHFGHLLEYFRLFKYNEYLSANKIFESKKFNINQYAKSLTDGYKTTKDFDSDAVELGVKNPWLENIIDHKESLMKHLRIKSGSGQDLIKNYYFSFFNNNYVIYTIYRGNFTSTVSLGLDLEKNFKNIMFLITCFLNSRKLLMKLSLKLYRFLRIYTLKICYKSWFSFKTYFKHFPLIKCISLGYFHNLLNLCNFNISIFIIHFFIFDRFKLVNKSLNMFRSSTIDYDTMIKSTNYIFQVYTQFIVMDYLSTFYWDFITYLNWIRSSMFLHPTWYIWDTIYAFGHLNFLELPVYDEFTDRTNFYLHKTKYNLELIMWQLFNSYNYSNDHIIQLNILGNFIYNNVQNIIVSIQFALYDLIIIKYFEYISDTHVNCFNTFEFLNDTFIKIFYRLNTKNITKKYLVSSIEYKTIINFRCMKLLLWKWFFYKRSRQYHCYYLNNIKWYHKFDYIEEWGDEVYDRLYGVNSIMKRLRLKDINKQILFLNNLIDESIAWEDFEYAEHGIRNPDYFAEREIAFAKIKCLRKEQRIKRKEVKDLNEEIRLYEEEDKQLEELKELETLRLLREQREVKEKARRKKRRERLLWIKLKNREKERLKRIRGRKKRSFWWFFKYYLRFNRAHYAEVKQCFYEFVKVYLLFHFYLHLGRVIPR